jgi:hypothetical protein
LLGIGIVAGLLSRQSGSTSISPSAGLQSSQAAADLRYVKKDTREETILATLQANRLPTLQGKWYALGPLAGEGNPLLHEKPPVQFNQSFPGMAGKPLSWKECTFPVGKLFATSDIIPDEDTRSLSCFYHEFSVERPIDSVMAVGSDVGIAVWLNDERIVVDASSSRPFKPDRIKLPTMRCKRGRNTLLIAVFSYMKGSKVYMCPQWPARLREQFETQLNHDFPQK